MPRTAVAVLLAATAGGCTSTEPTPPPTSMQTTLPASMHARTIDTMEVGDFGYVVPWAMWVDTESRMWLNPKYPLGHLEGTSTMRVERRDDGFYVWLSADSEYIPTEEPHYYGQEDLEWIRVVAVEGER